MKLQYHYALSGDSYDVRHTSGAIAKNLNFHVDSLGHYHAYPGYYTDREGLDTYLLLFTLSGQGYLEYQEREYFLTKDTAALISCSEHQFYRTESEDWEFKYIHFYGSSADKYYEMLRSQGAVFLDISDPIRMNELLKELKSWAAQSGGAADIRTASTMENIFAELLVEQLNPKQDKAYILHRKAIMEITDYIQEHYQEEVTVDLLADKVSMSKYYFIRVFKKATGISPYEYLKCCRINESKRLLKETAYSVGQIADMTGYKNVNIYIQNFKQCVGTTPLRYRKKAV